MLLMGPRSGPCQNYKMTATIGTEIYFDRRRDIASRRADIDNSTSTSRRTRDFRNPSEGLSSPSKLRAKETFRTVQIWTQEFQISSLLQYLRWFSVYYSTFLCSPGLDFCFALSGLSLFFIFSPFSDWDLRKPFGFWAVFPDSYSFLLYASYFAWILVICFSAE